VLITATVIFVLYKKIIYKKQMQANSQPKLIQPQPLAESDNKDVELNTEERKQNALYLLGEFLVYDKQGRDITHLFSPKIKQLFVLILLNSINREGISSKKISMILWPEKDVSKTKNIRGVTFNHLRNAISDITGLELTFIKDNYCFKLCEDFFCDYCIVSKMFTERNDSPVLENINLVLRGNLLKEMSDLWLENFKSDYEKRLIDLLNPQLKNLYVENELQRLLEISKLILSIDPFNDEALRSEIIALKKLKGIDYAKKFFDHFVEEYKHSIGTDYPFSFEKLISGVPA
jgi:two-component SAPR family response regulator